MVKWKTGATKIRYNIRPTKVYKTKTNVDNVHPKVPLIYLFTHTYICMVVKGMHK